MVATKARLNPMFLHCEYQCIRSFHERSVVVTMLKYKIPMKYKIPCSSTDVLEIFMNDLLWLQC